MAQRAAKPESVPSPSMLRNALTEQVEFVAVTELKKLGYRVRVTEISSLAKFTLAVRLCELDEKLALVSTVNGKDVQKRLGFPDHTCLILERDNYHFVPAWCELDMILSVINSIKNAPADPLCCACTSRTDTYCWKCSKVACRDCISTMFNGYKLSTFAHHAAQRTR